MFIVLSLMVSWQRSVNLFKLPKSILKKPLKQSAMLQPSPSTLQDMPFAHITHIHMKISRDLTKLWGDKDAGAESATVADRNEGKVNEQKPTKSVKSYWVCLGKMIWSNINILNGAAFCTLFFWIQHCYYYYYALHITPRIIGVHRTQCGAG